MNDVADSEIWSRIREDDVPPHCTVAGVPARQVGYPTQALPALEMDQSIDPEG